MERERVVNRGSRNLAGLFHASLSLTAALVAGLSPAISPKSFESYGACGDASFREG
jgi:hypothetical protein